ncbi:MAG: class I SAM-dependent methyltransferase [Gammaproteobacteria bacterium]
MKKKPSTGDYDIPPPVTQATRHAIYPAMDHDECARLNFVAACNRVITSTLTPGNEIAYRTQVLPEFFEEHGREPENRHEVRRAMNNNTFHRLWSATRRNLMEIRQQTGAAIVLRQVDELAERTREIAQDDQNLQMDPTLTIPRYVADVDHHCMPGSYHRELVDGDVSPAANYDLGFYVTTGGTVGPLNDEAGKAVASWVKSTDRYRRQAFRPRRILDIGVGVGHTILPVAQAFPEAEVVAIDVSAPMLRYAHARAKSLRVDNIQFEQMSGEDLSAFEDESFDWVQTSVFLHELSARSFPRILSECWRVLRPGGLTLHLEQPQYDRDMPVLEQCLRDWDAYNNNEPFWTKLHGFDIDAELVKTGFEKGDLFHAQLSNAQLAPTKTGDKQAGQDFGREPVWHAYGGWRKTTEVSSEQR